MNAIVPEGYCNCGCGQKTKISKYSCKKWGYVKDKPRRFIHNRKHKIPSGQTYQKRFGSIEAARKEAGIT